MTTYDIHAHCVPDGLLGDLERPASSERYGTEVLETAQGRVVRFAGGVTTPPIRPSLEGTAARLAAMDAAGVDVQLVSGWIDLTGYGLPSRQAAPYARMVNESLAATLEPHPDRFRGLCTVPMQDPDAAIAELRHAISELDMVGVQIATTVDGVELDDPGFEPFWSAAEELRCPVLLHPLRSLEGRGVSRHLLGNLVGNPAESTIALAHLLFGGVLERHPDLRLVVVHGGGFAPWQAGRWDRGFAAVHQRTGQHITSRPSDLLRRVWFDTVLHDPFMLEVLIRWAGVDQVVLGSDYPFPMGDPDPLGTLRQVPSLSEQQFRAIAGGNIERMLAEVAR